MSLVQRFERNTAGRDFAVGDIHGCFTLLQSALDAAGFDPAAGDRLFSVGDLVDRGHESHQAPDWIAKPWFHAVQGNHEGMAILWRNGAIDRGSYKSNGGEWLIESPMGERVRIAESLQSLPIAMEVETAAGLVGLVHADCPRRSWQVFTRDLESAEVTQAQRSHALLMALWSRSRITGQDESGVEGLHALIVGHTPVDRKCQLGNVHFIDTGGWFPGGKFTVIDLATLGDRRDP